MRAGLAAVTDNKIYCTCRQPDNGREMVACDSKTCKIEWFHLDCVGLKKVPKGKWFCESCKALKMSKKGF